MEQRADKEKAKEILTQYLDENKYRKTPERYAVLEAAYSIGKHFTSDELCDYMRESFRVSRATVYNTLELLADAELVVRHQFRNVTEYERRIGMKPHHHQVCTECGRISEFVSAEVDNAVAKVKLRRFRMTRSEVYVYGICSSCVAKRNKAKQKKQK